MWAYMMQHSVPTSCKNVWYSIRYPHFVRMPDTGIMYPHHVRISDKTLCYHILWSCPLICCRQYLCYTSCFPIGVLQTMSLLFSAITHAHASSQRLLAFLLATEVAEPLDSSPSLSKSCSCGLDSAAVSCHDMVSPATSCHNIMSQQVSLTTLRHNIVIVYKNTVTDRVTKWWVLQLHVTTSCHNMVSPAA